MTIIWLCYHIGWINAGVAQLVEHELPKLGVAGSNPVARSKVFQNDNGKKAVKNKKSADMELSNKSILTFDCYGTLIDWESGIWDGFQRLLMANKCQMTRHACLEDFAKCESQVQAEQPAMLYPQILRETHRRFAAMHELKTTEELDDNFGEFVPFWPAFPDSADALRQLKKHFKLVILSNVDRASFASSNARLGVEFDAIYTAQDVGSYKPNPANFDYMITHLADDLNAPKEHILHVAQSLFHDIQPAQSFDLPSIWIDRQNLEGGGSWGATAKVAGNPVPDKRFTSMAAFADWACQNKTKTD